MATQPDKTDIDFSINYATLIFGLLVTGLAIIGLYFLGDYYSIHVDVRDYIALFTCGIVCTALIYNAKNVRLTHRYHEERLDFEKAKLEAENKRKIAEYSLLVCSEWFKPGICEQAHKARFFLNNNKPKFKENNGIMTGLIEEDLENRKAVMTVLNYFEHIALLIEKRLVDEEIIKDAFKTLFCDYHSLLKPYIKERQSESPRFIIKYDSLARKWSLN